MIGFPYVVKGLATAIGEVVAIDDWAQRVGVPDRHRPGERLSGAQIERIVGVRSKSWEPKRFRSLDLVCKTAARALESSGIPRGAIDAAIIVTCTPFELMLDQDSFKLLRELGIPDDVVPIQLGAGCAGFARAAALAAKLTAKNVLVITYNATSPIFELPDGSVNANYLENAVHPHGAQLWASAALFSDGVAVAILSRPSAPAPSRDAFCLYSRDSLVPDSTDPTFGDPLIHYLGGGVSAPSGSSGSAELACYGMNGAAVKRYYMAGMLRNHRELRAHAPDYDRRVRRIYTHQASPALVRGFLETVGFDPGKVGVNVEVCGNLVTPSTLRILHEDLVAGRIERGDELCISVVGAGPERGALLATVDVATIVPLDDRH